MVSDAEGPALWNSKRRDTIICCQQLLNLVNLDLLYSLPFHLWPFVNLPAPLRPHQEISVLSLGQHGCKVDAAATGYSSSEHIARFVIQTWPSCRPGCQDNLPCRSHCKNPFFFGTHLSPIIDVKISCKWHSAIFKGNLYLSFSCRSSFPPRLGGVQDSNHDIYEIRKKKSRKNKQKKILWWLFLVFYFCLGSSQLFRLKYNLHWGKELRLYINI